MIVSVSVFTQKIIGTVNSCLHSGTRTF